MKTILIAGGAGFIGSNLCEKLINMNHNIICLDNLLTGNMKNIEHLLDKPNFTFINHDIIESFDISEDIHEIYNLACPASPPKYQINPIYTLKINFITPIRSKLHIYSNYSAVIRKTIYLFIIQNGTGIKH